MIRRSLVGLMAAMLLMGLPTEAQTRSVYWDRWDVEIDEVDPVANSFNVREIYDIEFTGTFSFGERVIPITNLEAIRDIEVFENGQALRAGCNTAPGTYCVSTRDGQTSIAYYFRRSITNDEQNFIIEYTVVGALRVYDSGDQLWWSAIPEEHFGFAVGSSTITVDLPAGYAPRAGVDPVVTYGAPANLTVEGTRVRAVATRQIGGNEAFEIRVQYPHHSDARQAGWQSGFDIQRQFDENVRPLLTILFAALSMAILLGGPLLTYTYWLRRGRDPQVIVPEYLSELPSQLSPAVVGALIDETADVRDVISILLDLAHRGYLVIQEDQISGFLGIGSHSEFVFKRTDKSLNDLQPFEQRVVSAMFKGNSMERTMDSLKNEFYTVIADVQSKLYDQLVKENFFNSNPNNTRGIWTGLGIVVVAAAVFGVFAGSELIEQAGFPLLMLFGAVGVNGLVIVGFAQVMPAKTRRGAEEAAKWKAFERYLRNLERYSTLEEAAARFDDFLPYAVAFGLEQSWIRRFSDVSNVPIPPWYYPTYMGGSYGRGYIPGTTLYGHGGMNGAQNGLPGELARAEDGNFSLEGMSGKLAGGLENISTGLATMIDSAGHVMTSRPQSASSGSSGSWSSGGSSWSGGGSSGGGSSGGGSSGFG